MKSILILLLMAFSNTILATGAERENKSYRFIGYGKIFEFDTNKSIDIVNNGDKITGSIVYFEMSDPGDYVEYVDTRTLDNQTFIVFSFWKYDVKATADYRKYNINDDNEQLFFLMKEEDFDQKTIEVPSHLQFSPRHTHLKIQISP
ncbi:MAG: hypothetical protein IPP69_00095 [Flavobacteriales bacterium]|nr:hypothetical protein [Flavobacteriales bacterium]